MTGDLVLAVDQGTSSTKCVLVDAAGAVVATGSAPVGIAYPRPGWVQQDADEIVASVLAAARGCLAGVDPARVAGVGFSTQRESALLWDAASGRPVGPVLGWQDRRSVGVCERVRAAGHQQAVRRLSGLPLDPMFSAAKISWLLAEHDPDHSRAGAGRLVAGTVDAWLLRALTGQDRIEAGNASRTQLLDVRDGRWSAELLSIFDVPAALLPEIVPSAAELGRIGSDAGVLSGLPIRAVLGDSHAALLAHGPRSAGGAKVTYGTGSSVMRLVDKPDDDQSAVCLTVAWAAPELQPALEGNIRSTGATIVWLAELLGCTQEQVAQRAAGAASAGVCLVPAFGGLAAPWWDEAAVGLISGLTLGSGPDQLARAGIESIAHQVDDVVAAMSGSAGELTHLLADGGASANDVLMQIQADLSGLPVLRAQDQQLSALGAAHLAGRVAGLWADPPSRPGYDRFTPQLAAADAAQLRRDWRAAVARSRGSVDGHRNLTS